MGRDGDDIIIAVCDSPMGRQHPFFYLDLARVDPLAHCEEFCENVKWSLVRVVVTGLKRPSPLSAREMIEKFVD